MDEDFDCDEAQERGTSYEPPPGEDEDCTDATASTPTAPCIVIGKHYLKNAKTTGRNGNGQIEREDKIRTENDPTFQTVTQKENKFRWDKF
jgi:hypothetical protein